MEIPHSVSLLDGLELCTSHVRSISTKPLTRAAELCDAVPKGACSVKFSEIFTKIPKFFVIFPDFQKIFAKIHKHLQIFVNLKQFLHFFRFLAMQKYVDFVDFEKCCKMRIWM